MPIIYYLDYPCPVKEQVPPGRMLRLIYGRERANEALHRARQANPDVQPHDVKVDLSLKDHDRTSHLVTTTVAEVEQQYAELDRHAYHCIDCRAKIENHSFGCRGCIDYPFSQAAERMFMSRIHASHGDPTAGMLANYFENNGITGNCAADKRNLPGVFFESDKPLVRRFEDGRRISSNQVFELFFETGRITPNHARFLLGMFELLEANLPLHPPLDNLPNLFVVEKQESGMVVERVGLKLSAGQVDPCTRQVENFLGGLLLSSELGHDLLIKT
jgi:hypothetical protein